MAWGTNWPSLDKADTITIEHVKNFKNTFKKQGSNLVDAEGLLYFQCEGCQTLFDPDTKSFATLHDFAHAQGWKVKWNINGLGYKIYCAECKGSLE